MGPQCAKSQEFGAAEPKKCPDSRDLGGGHAQKVPYWKCQNSFGAAGPRKCQTTGIWGRRVLKVSGFQEPGVTKPKKCPIEAQKCPIEARKVPGFLEFVAARPRNVRIWGRRVKKVPEFQACGGGGPGPENAQCQNWAFGPAPIPALYTLTLPSELDAFQAGPESLEFAAFGCFSGLVTSNARNLAPAGSYSGEVCVCEGPKIRKKIGGNSSS